MGRFMRIVVRFTVGTVLIWFAGNKLLAKPVMPGGVSTVYDSLITNGSTTHYVLIGGEMLLGLWLSMGVWNRASALVTVVVISTYSGFLALEVRKDSPRPCGCLTGVVTNDPSIVRRQLKLGLLRNAAIIVGASWLFSSRVRSGQEINVRRLEPTPVAPVCSSHLSKGMP